MDLNTELSKIGGISASFVSKLSKLKICSVRDLLWHFPFRYDDFSKIIPISDLVPGQPATIHGTIQKIGMRRTFRKKLVLIEAIIVDETGGIRATWFNQIYLLKTLKTGTQANFAGKVVDSKNGVYLASPVHEITSSRGISSAESGPSHTAGLIPVYSETRGVSSKFLRYIMKPILKLLPPIEEFLPKETLLENNLPDINFAIKKIHFPLRMLQAEMAKKRFAFENLFLFQLNNLKIKLKLADQKSTPIPVDKFFLSKLISQLPFLLTNSQKDVLKEVLLDIQRDRPMNRLLQGDVGSGKTIIAALAAILVAKDEHQVAILAPTEILAQQHYHTLTNLFKGYKKEIEILTASSKKKKVINEKIKSGEIKIVIGTHAIIQKSVEFNDLALVIVDEQHRFGVQQRAELVARGLTQTKTQTNADRISGKSALVPHFLSMSATPIPRTLAITIFGDLDLSIINEMPPGRKVVTTKVVEPVDRLKAYGFIKEQVKKGRQAFVICPRIEPFEARINTDYTRTNADTIDADYVDNTQTNDQRSMTNDPTLTDEYGASKERKSKEQNDQRVITDNQQITTDDKDEKNEERIRERRGENPPQPSFLKEGVGHGNDPSEIVRQGRNFTGQAEGRGGNIERRFLSEAQQKILELKSVKEEFDKLSSKVFPDLKIAMLHGKMKSIEKEKIMKGFLDKEYDILVCTSVVEVGIDVPNATIMMIEGSDRFGLAQLYQFRGRVGRGAHQSFCFLFTDSESQSTQKRLEFLQSAKNGFELAEKDLELRGPGQFLGKVQTGIPDIAMDSLKDIKLVKAAKSSAEELLSNDPKFSKHPLLAKRFKEFQERVHME